MKKKKKRDEKNVLFFFLAFALQDVRFRREPGIVNSWYGGNAQFSKVNADYRPHGVLYANGVIHHQRTIFPQFASRLHQESPKLFSAALPQLHCRRRFLLESRKRRLCLRRVHAERGQLRSNRHLPAISFWH